MSRDILLGIIDDFQVDSFKQFFRTKNRSFAPHTEDLNEYNDDNFEDSLKLGDIDFSKEGQELIVCSFETLKPLTERSGKKAQYEKGKKVLKQLQADAGIFIFYDNNGSFRFSLIYANYLGKKRDWSTFRRYTYFVSPGQTNKTFLQQIGNGDFSTLEKIKKAFSVEAVTKDFYKDIANWYFWAVQHSEFPKDAEAEDNGRNIAIIRLITRLIFIWFMRERGLVPNSLFDKNKIYESLKDVSPDKSTYYQAILQNLFFATLSTKKEERQFRSEFRGHKGYNPDFGNQYVFRYHNLFKNPDDIKEYFENIPFLNGGLFECLDDKQKRIYIDGFTSTKKHQPVVPNFLFFSDEDKADLNTEYGTKNKKYNVRGLLETLSYYNFTIDENDPNDAEIALDPELLGKVFENLLASFNPETASTARKATGSYYTPREIVDYMVTQSLKEYLKTHLKGISGLDKNIDTLFDIESEDNPFDDSESKEIVRLIDNLRIVDPAVGSGAFPMGILNKLVFVLGKLDPDNKLWKKAQTDAVRENVSDPALKRRLIEQICEQFKNKNLDYGRKLYLIQKCIYGVDIQQIAVEIAKLRFFIALLVDERIDKDMDNWGIEPLPNLDFKIMQGNSLVSEFMGINLDNGEPQEDNQTSAFKDDIDDLIDEFKQKKNEYQNEPDSEKKSQLRQEIDYLLVKLFETKLKKQKTSYFTRLKAIEKKYSTVPNKEQRNELIAKDKNSLSKKEGFDLDKFEEQLRELSGKTKTKPFFAWKLYFAEVFQGNNPGFDIIIANPPYIVLPAKSLDQFQWTKGNKNTYVAFLEKASYLITGNGVISYIIPTTWLAGNNFIELRKSLLESRSIQQIVQLPYDIFEVFVDNLILILAGKDSSKSKVETFRFDIRTKMNSNFALDKFDVNTWLNDSQAVIFLNKKLTTILDKYRKLPSERLGDIAKVQRGTLPPKRNEKILDTSDKKSRILIEWFTGQIYRYQITNGEQFVVDYNKLRENKPLELFEKTKILGRQLISRQFRLQFAYFDKKCAFKKNLYAIYDLNHKYNWRYLLAFLNSKFFSFIQVNLNASGQRDDYPAFSLLDYKNFLVPIATSSQQNKLVALAIKAEQMKLDAIGKTEQGFDQEQFDILDDNIDNMIYNLYDLTPEEIAIVEGKEEE